METIIEIPLARIAPSPLNPRKHWNEGTVGQLAESIKQVGVQQPIVVRHAGAVPTGEHYELVFGHRRVTAANLAGLYVVPGIVRSLTDDQVLEIQIIENSQREDVHPLDEADGFAALIARGYTIAKIADKIGRTPAFVATRLKLTDLCANLRKLYDAEQLTLGAAMALARLPKKLQMELAEHDMPYHDEIMSEVEARHLCNRYMVALAGAAFDVTDAKLVPKAGSCVECPKRTGNQAELFADAASPDICTDAVCFKSKCDAMWTRVKKEPGDHIALLDGKAGRAAAQGDYNSAYVPADGELYLNGGKRVNVAAVIKKAKDAAPPLGLAYDEAKGTIAKVVSRKEIERLAIAQMPKEKNGAQAYTVPDDVKAAEKKAREKQILEARIANACIDVGVINAANGNIDQDLILRMVVKAYAHRLWNDHQKLICSRRGLEVKSSEWGGKDYGATLAKHIDELDAGGVRGMAAELAMVGLANSNDYRGEKKAWKAALEALKVDEPSLRAAAVADAKAIAAEKKAKAKKRAAKLAKKEVKA